MDTIAWVSITVGLSVVTLFTLIALAVNKRREHKRIAEDGAAETALARIDEAGDALLTELNKTAKLALDEINDRYQAMLFLYNILDAKKREIQTLMDAGETLAERSAAAGRQAAAASCNTPAVQTEDARPSVKRKSRPAGTGLPVGTGLPAGAGLPANPRDARRDSILALYREGRAVADIAKQLSIGHGEVQLTVDLAERGTEL